MIVGTYGALAGAAVVAAHVYQSGGYGTAFRDWGSPDAERYLAMGRGEVVPSPYSRRWLLPRLLGDKLNAWRAVSWGSIAVTGALVERYAGFPAALLYLALPVVRVNACLPVLTDAPAFALAVGATLVAPEHPVLAVVLSLLAGACKESAPVFAALFAWNPLLLLGVLGAGWFRKSKAPDESWLHASTRQALEYFRGKHDFFDWRTMLLPWGPALPLAALFCVNPSRGLVCLAAGYGQLLIAADRARLYQWAALPVVAAAALTPAPWLYLACFLAFFNPYRGV